jgi:hypothetical protein
MAGAPSIGISDLLGLSHVKLYSVLLSIYQF